VAARSTSALSTTTEAILEVAQNAAVAAVAEQRPIRLVVRDDELRRSRITVFLRLLLAIPHLAWLLLWSVAASVVALVLWLAVLIEGKAPGSLHDFVAGYLRYATHVSAYVYLAANPYPGFRGAPGYAVDLEIDPPARQSRWTGFFRLPLALPALALAGALGSGFTVGGSLGASTYGAAWLYAGAGAGATAAFLAWFAALARGTAPRGLRELVTYAIGYSAQSAGYLLLLTGRYPSSDPSLVLPPAELPPHPVRIDVSDDLVRPRLLVFFRVFLAVPHLVWLALWSVAGLLAVLAAWLAALVLGRVPSRLHRFLAAYVRYATHVAAFVCVLGRRFPGFTGRESSYGIDVVIAPAARQQRLKTLVRLALAVPALVVAGALGGVALTVAVLGWWSALVTRRMPEGLRNLGASCLRYGGQSSAYVLLLTDRYPYAAPVLHGPPAPVFEHLPPALPGDAF